VLAWNVSFNYSAHTTLTTLKEAYFKYIHHTNNDVDLIVDGGPENNNTTVDEFINDPAISVRKIIAGRDIHFSNSMVEAVNKLVKYRHLFLHDIPDIHALVTHLSEFIPIYNEVRPHISLKGLTPFEVLNGLSPDNENDLVKVNLKSKNRSFERTHEINCTECI
jgi:putative transposase